MNQALYVVCALAFLCLIALVLLRGRVAGLALVIVTACAFSALWAADIALFGPLGGPIGALFDSVRLSSWLIFMVMAIQLGQRGADWSPALLPLSIGFCILIVGSEAALAAGVIAGSGFSRVNDLLRVGLAVGGLLAAENLWRNTGEPHRRWQLWPFCLASGAMFAFELFLRADRLMIPGASPILTDGQGLVALIAVPLLALSMARNRDWNVDIHVSRTVVFHSAVLVSSGLFFLGLAAIGFTVREVGGRWGPGLQLVTLLGSAIVLSAALGSSQFRLQLKRLIDRHFYSHRFDYRTEWLRFVDTVAERGDEHLSVRVIRALAQVVDSQAGTLWRRQEDGTYLPEAGWNCKVIHGREIPAGDPFINAFRGGNWIQAWEQGSSFGRLFVDRAEASLAIPLQHADELIAFVVLKPSSVPYKMDWESFDLLRAAARQAASYIAEESSARALQDARLLTDYSKRFAFVLHDMKNIAGQLGLIVSNARRHIENPEFRTEMIESLGDTVGRMDRLIAHLRQANRENRDDFVVPDLVIATLAQELTSDGISIETKLDAGSTAVAMNRDQFHSMLSHLINNAHEASAAPILVASRVLDNKVMVDVVDKGPGMDDDFVRNEFLRPFRSTKPDGMGIGGYQIREQLRLAGGQLEIMSAKGVGTVMRMTLPAKLREQVISSAA